MMDVHPEFQLDLPTREHKIVAVIDALDDYVQAKVDYEYTYRNNYNIWEASETVRHTSNVLQAALEELLK